MLKYLSLLILPALLLIQNNTAHAADMNIKDYKKEKAKIHEQRKELKKQFQEATGNKKIRIGMKENKLAAYEEAYKKALEYAEPPEQVKQQPDTTGQTFSFVPAKLQPGEVVPKEYIPIYKAAGEKFGVDWYVLASIHHIETDYSRIKVMVSSVGAIGHMQFMPSTFDYYAIDGNGDGRISAWNLQDSIFTAANYLSKSGYKKDVRKAIWHYNHADWYVNDVLETAGKIKGVSI